MKKYFIFAIAALAMVSCNKEKAALVDAPEGNGVIAFNSLQEKMTKATGSAAATALGNNFIVYGFKYATSEDLSTTANDKSVFDLYNVHYNSNTAGTTESNTADWEYVGLTSHGSSPVTQNIKYWDYSATGYVFSAVSGSGITATKTKTGATVYDKGWTVELPAGADLSTLYASERKPVLKSAFGNQVNLTFYCIGTKVRFAMYETVPGYDVKIDRFYYKDANDWKINNTNFAIGGTFKTANATTTTPVTITYYDAASGIENHPKVTFTNSQVTEKTYGTFGANLLAGNLGYTSVTATYDKADKSYTMILPYLNNDGMQLYVDYTLTAIDNSEDVIKVKHASAKVPSGYTQWKENFAYTYIFKISDKTNGTTGDPGTNPSDPDDPTVPPTDPTLDPDGLFPITFDACVVEAADGMIQEVVATVSTPTILTYQEGAVVTANDEYVAGTIYASVEDNTVLSAANAHLYVVTGGADAAKVSEARAALAIKQGKTDPSTDVFDKTNVELTQIYPAAGDYVASIPASDGGAALNIKAMKWNATAGTTYVVEYVNGTNKAYKVVKVKP